MLNGNHWCILKRGGGASSVLEARCDRAWPGMGKALLSGHGLRCVMCGGPMCLTSPARNKDHLCQLLGRRGEWGAFLSTGVATNTHVYSGCMHGVIINLALDHTYNEAFQSKRRTIATPAFILSSPLLLLLWMLFITLIITVNWSLFTVGQAMANSNSHQMRMTNFPSGLTYSLTGTSQAHRTGL